MGGFRKATKHESRLRLALSGPSGSGKTYTALRIATALSDKVAVIDTERGSASKYADEFEFDVLEPESFHPQVYIDAIRNAEQDGYEVLIIDSLSHAWVGKDGELELVDRVQQRSRSSNSFAAWREVTPLHNALVDAMLTSRCHIIATMRAKTAYSMDQDERGKTQVRKLGMEPVMRDGIEYEFDVHAMMDMSNTMLVMKSRCKALTGAVIQHPGADVAATLREWLGGEPLPETTTSHPSSQSGGGNGDATRSQAAASWSPAEQNRFRAEAMGPKGLGLSNTELKRLLPELAEGKGLSDLGSVDDVLALLRERIETEAAKEATE